MDAVILLIWLHIVIATAVLMDSLINYLIMDTVIADEHPLAFLYWMIWALIQLVGDFYRLFVLGVTGANGAIFHLIILDVGIIFQWLAQRNLKKVLKA